MSLIGPSKMCLRAILCTFVLVGQAWTVALDPPDRGR